MGQTQIVQPLRQASFLLLPGRLCQLSLFSFFELQPRQGVKNHEEGLRLHHRVPLPQGDNQSEEDGVFSLLHGSGALQNFIFQTSMRVREQRIPAAHSCLLPGHALQSPRRNPWPGSPSRPTPGSVRWSHTRVAEGRRTTLGGNGFRGAEPRIRLGVAGGEGLGRELECNGIHSSHLHAFTQISSEALLSGMRKWPCDLRSYKL